ncbi:S8 family serine peptidase [Pseudalkalibacillus salsuginis]|uniref:S8 family serine peptidase n=1 Tax=Pseudalkalibacillus salsuginis TaxID=2910972 RepID=UPI001F29A9C8|nr:S8 family serine peptidase [Pseudalkalibacillus salsuginis]MCF6409257.1 S8 family serine peptidase [Pseudalkalibacillus salsuginis]
MVHYPRFLLNRRAFAFVTAIILLVSTFLAPTANARTIVKQESNPISTSFKKEAQSNKVSKSLQKQFKDEEQVTFLIKFHEQVDTAKVAKNAIEKAEKQQLTPYKKELTQRSEVVSSLRSTAIETQGNVKNFLKKQKEKKAVKDYQSFFIVNAMAVTANKEVMEQLAAFPEVAKVLPNEVRQLQPMPQTTKASTQPKGDVENETSSVEWNVERVGAPAVWNMGIDGSGTVIANIDTGVQWNHPGLVEQYRGYDPANPDSPSHEMNWFDATAGQDTPYDDQGHGTHTMGTMVGAEPDGSNQVGVAPGAKWIAVKAFTADGGSDVDLLEAGEWIIAPTDADGNLHPEMAPDVVNNSWGGGPGLDEWYRPMVQNWRAADIFPEFSAGNTTIFNPGGPGSVATPANYPESFATGATDINDNLASFSLEGPSPYDEIKPDVSAPGVNIRSTVPGSAYEGGWNGTSMAGPHVSAVVALLRQVDSSLTVDEIEEILLSTAEPMTNGEYPDSPNNGFGYGIVNAYDAVSSVINGLGVVKGSVTKEGDDAEAPTFEHEAPAETYAGLNLPLSVTASDNISVTNVRVEYEISRNNWEAVEAVRTDGDYQSGRYEAVIPGDAIEEPVLKYRWVIGDFGGNNVTSDDYEVTVLPGISTGYSTDFESEPTGWITWGDNNTWEWGAPTSGPGEAASGEKVYATNLDGDYDNNANMTLMMPPIDLGDGEAYLQFNNWYNLENNYDYGHVVVSTDQENWEQVAQFNNVSDGWVEEEIDLSEYANQRIYIGFNVDTDGSVLREGWYIDDVRLSDASINPSSKASLFSGKDKSVKGDKPEKADDKAAKKEKVNPAELMPTKRIDLEKKKDEGKDAGPSALPLEAEVSILESGRSTTTNPVDGSYTITHAAGDFTIVAEAYGFHPQEQSVTIPDDGEVEADFTLEEKAQGTVSGTVTNSQTGEPIEGVTVLLEEDAAVTPVESDTDGNYSLTGYVGDYTLKVMASGYYGEEFSITIDDEEATIQDAQLKPFIGYPGEIGFDDGTAENARAFYDAGNGWGVRMSLPEGKEQAFVTGGMFRFWTNDWPTPGGTDFQVEIWDADEDGSPGEKLAGPVDATALRNGEWTHVDLSDQGVTVDGDFFMVYIQSDPHPNAPGLGADENGPDAERSWQFVSGAWSQTPAVEGNYMIRATVDYEVTAPVITSPADGTHTNDEKVTVEGQSAPGVDIHLENNGEETAVVATNEDGTFSADITLVGGENVLIATAVNERGMTDPSEPVTVILDQTKPELTIESPEDGTKTNRMAVNVTGNVDDEYLDWVKVNGQRATVNEDGSYSHRILLDEGENVIKVVAKDLAGNRKNQTVTVDAKFGPIEVTNVKPDMDKNLESGQSVMIEFDSEQGLEARFRIHMPLTNMGMVQNANELPMMETTPGHYVGYYTATSNVVADGAVVEVVARDDYGNETEEIAEGKLYINAEE